MNKAKSVWAGRRRLFFYLLNRVFGFHKTYSQGLDNSYSTKDPTEGKFHVSVAYAIDKGNKTGVTTEYISVTAFCTATELPDVGLIYITRWFHRTDTPQLSGIHR